MEGMQSVNAKRNKMCAFCKYWYDPCNSCIQPKAPNIGVWWYDYKAKKMCTKKGVERQARSSCRDYECKV